MNTQDKSLKLAELMEWKVSHITVNKKPFAFVCSGMLTGNMCVQPYSGNRDGLAQFAAILLKFPEVMLRFKWRYRPIVLDAESKARAKKIWNIQPTQANILDEILRMNGVNMDAN